MIRVPVLSPKGKPLMPAKASRVRRWLGSGKAKVIHNDLGLFQVQLIEPPSGEKTQSGDTKSQVSVSDANWKRLGQFTAKKVQLLQRNTGLVSTVGLSNLTASSGTV
jgi:hypothetical protein